MLIEDSTQLRDVAMDEIMGELEKAILGVTDAYSEFSHQAHEALHDTSRQRFKAVHHKKRRRR